MIKLNKIEPEIRPLYFKDEFIGNINEYEFNDIRIQVIKEKVDGYYILGKFNEKCPLGMDGTVTPYSAFTLMHDQIFEIAMLV